MTDGLTWLLDEDATAVYVRLDGTLTRRSATRLGTVLRKLLLDRGRIVVDTTAVRVQWPTGVSIFPTTLTTAGGWPTARMVLVDGSGATARVVRAAGIATEVPLVADPAAARAALERRPRRVRRATEMPPDGIAPAFARALVRAACEDWDLDAADGGAELVVNELVSNAVVHAGGRPVLVLTHDDRGLTVAVRDASVRTPAVPPDPGPGAALGLRVVAQLSEHWGVTPHGDGKTVWALLRPGMRGDGR